MAPILVDRSTSTSPSLTPWDSMNLLGGVAPFLALLGEDFTNRYLSLSHNCCDWVVFSVIPTGVPYAMKVLSRLLKLQNIKMDTFYTSCRKALEKDLLSTCSKEICEIWNGRQVERVEKTVSRKPGPIREYIYLPGREDAPPELLPTKIAKYGGKYRDRMYNPWLQPAKGSPIGLRSLKENETTDPPNLLLNLTPFKRSLSMYILCIFGLTFQVGIMVFTAFTAFHPSLISRFFDKASPAFRITAFACVESGTIFLFLSLLYTAKSLTLPLKVRRSTWKLPDGEKAKVVWVQRQMQGDGWHTEAYILAKNIEAEVLSAHRDSTALSHHWCFKSHFTNTVLVLIPVSFVLQSVGLSMMHWAVQTWQFIALVFMFFGRRRVRKEVPPEFVLRLRDEWARAKIQGILAGSPVKDMAADKAVHVIEHDLRTGRKKDRMAQDTVQKIVANTGIPEANIVDDVTAVVNKIFGGPSLLDEDIEEAVKAPT
ncbi:hypothetical protein VB005_01551 [Metarhizium brunneum]